MAGVGVDGVSADFKMCTGCGVTQPTSEYFQDKRRNGFRSTCKTCARAHFRAWYGGRLDALKEQRSLVRKTLKRDTLEHEQLHGRQCRTCKATKEITEFYSHPSYHNARRSECKGCFKNRTYVRNKKDAERHRREWRRLHLRRSYGLSEVDFQTLFDKQGRACGVCQTSLDNKRKQKGPYVDHCHASGVVRGILCFACNSGLGRFKDDPMRLRRAAEYIERSRPHGEPG